MAKAETKSITIRLPAHIHERLVAEADREHRSMQAQVAFILERALEGRAAR